MKTTGAVLFLLLCTQVLAQLPNRLYLHLGQVNALSGDTGDCADPLAASCTGGVAALAAYNRYWRARGRIVVSVPSVDRSSIYVQMHPQTWGLNKLVYDRLGFTSYFGPGSLLDEKRPGTEVLRSPTGARAVMGNSFVKPSHDWYSYIGQWHVESGVALTSLYDENFHSSDIVVATMETSIANLRRTRSDVRMVIVFLSNAATFDQVLLLSTLTSAPNLVIIDAEGDPSVPSNFTTLRRNSTTFQRVDGLGPIHVFDIATDGVNVQSVTMSEVDDADGLTADMKDATWVAQQTWLHQQAVLSTANDPVKGTALTEMPVIREDSTRICMAGECAVGTMYVAGARDYYSADLGFANSGGFRGPGWPAGPIRVSNIWSCLPFANVVCRGTILGLKLYEILNHSTSLATFTTTRTPTGNHLMQLDNIRMVYNSNLETNRLLSVEVRNRETGEFEPLERLKLYTYAVESFLCTGFEPYERMLNTEYEGETKGRLGDVTLQDTVGAYLEKVKTISHAPTGSHIDIKDVNTYVRTDGTTFDSQSKPMMWTETRESCGTNTFWKPSQGSCIPCPTGLVQPVPGQDYCVLASPEASKIGIYVGVPLGILAVLGIVAAVVRAEYLKSKNVRNVKYAPKDGQITLLFTDIQDSTKLWSSCPASMSLALDYHHRIIRASISKFNGYEVKTVGDSFMIAVGDCQEAVKLAVDIQEGLQSEKFPAAIAEVYEAKTGDSTGVEVDDDPERMADIHPLWNGVRVRIGIHTGYPDVQFDVVTKGYDYYGPPVNVAARVESVAKGGQITCTKEVVEKVGSLFQSTSLGSVTLKGVCEPVSIYSIAPPSLNGRIYAALVVEEDEGTQGSSHGSMMSGGNRDLVEYVSQMQIVREGVVSLNVAEAQIHQLVEHYDGLLKVMRPKDRDAMVEQWAKAWRVKARKTTTNTIEHICLRIYPQFAAKSGLNGMGSSMNLKQSLRADNARGEHRQSLPGQIQQVESVTLAAEEL